MRKYLIIVVLVILLLPGLAYAVEEQENLANEVLNEYTVLYGGQIQDGVESIEGNGIDDLVPNFNAEQILQQLTSGDLDLSIPGLLNTGLHYLLGEVYRSLKIMALVLALTVLCAYLTNLKTSFQAEGVEQIAFFACYILIAGIATAAFYDTAQCAQTAIQNISVFMRLIVPLVITALITSGAMISAAVFEPVLLSVVEIAVTVINSVFLPLVMLSTAMNIVNSLSDKFKADRLVKLLNTSVKWGLSIMLTIFVGVAGIQSIAAAGADGLTVKISKFAASNLIPVVGGILAESVETVMNCSVVIKNSVGILGIIVVALIAVTPLLKIAAVLIIFRITAAVAEPISDPKIISCVSHLANSISVIFSMLAAVTVMFIIVLTIVLNAGNTAVLLGR